MLCEPSSPMLAYYSIAFGDNAPRFGHQLLETATTEFTIMSFVCVVYAAQYNVAELFIPARIQTLSEGGCLQANGGFLVRLPSEMRASTLKRGLLRLINDCTVAPLYAILDDLRAGESDWSAPNCIGWVTYDFKNRVIVSVPEWQTQGWKQGLRRDTLLGVVHTKVVPRYMEQF